MKMFDIRSAQFNDTYFPILDGVVYTVHNYALEMNRISESYVVCPKQKEKSDDSALSYDVIRTASLKTPFVNYALALPTDPAALRKIIKRGNIDIIHVHSPFMTGKLGLCAARKMNIPVVATFHSKYYTDILQFSKSHTIAAAATKRIVAFYNQCDAVWACSEGTAETLRSYGYKKKITVMHNGTDMTRTDQIEEQTNKARTFFGISRDKTVLLFAGSLIWQKNLKLVLDTFRLLEQVRPNSYQLVLAGIGNHEKEIKDYAARLKLKSIVFTGAIYNRELLSGLYSAADLFFFPSVYDNAPLVVREAAVFLTPTIAVSRSNTADVILPDVNGFTAEDNPQSMAKKIVEITNRPELINLAGKKASETIPILWKEIVEQVYEQYEAVIRNTI